ncbi:hypothetical protein GCM10027443_25280 [Pontibacter brevis]
MGNKSLLIDKADESLLFKHGFFDENVLALKVDSKNEYAVFVNENKYGGDFNSLDKVLEFLKEHYLKSTLKPHIEHSTGYVLSNKDRTNNKDTISNKGRTVPLPLTPEQVEINKQIENEIKKEDKLAISITIFVMAAVVVMLFFASA